MLEEISQRRLLVAAALLAVAAVTGTRAMGELAAAPTPGPSLAIVESAPPTEAPTPAVTVPPTPEPTPTPSPTEPPVRVAFVPVTGYWSAERTISRTDLAALVGGTAAAPRTVFVARGDLELVADALGVTPGPAVAAIDPASAEATLAKNPSALLLLRPEQVVPSVRALAVDGVALFGGGRVRDLAAWPLVAAAPAGTTPSSFDPATAWTLAAGGDVMLDRSIYEVAVLEKRGRDTVWAGGFGRITGTYCCGAPGFQLVRGAAAGGAGAVRTLLSSADLTIVNLENPVPDDWTYHASGLVFTMDPAFLPGMKGAGIDLVSLANNHLRDDGSDGVLDTLENLAEVGIRPVGAGRNLTEARRAVVVEAGGQSVAFLAYNGIAPSRNNATASRPGAAPLTSGTVKADVAAARRAGADVVVVLPHWGKEYLDRLNVQQETLGPVLLAAGADLVLGTHSHWAGPVTITSRQAVVWSMGNLAFDLIHDARTQQGIIVEATFDGPRLAQLELHPTLILDAFQPVLLTPDGGGRALLDTIRRASAKIRL